MTENEDITKSKKLVKSFNLLRERITIAAIIVAISAILVFITTLTSFMAEAPVWCETSFFEDFRWCQPPVPPPPCSSSDKVNTIECASSLFMEDNYHNPANLQIKTLQQDGVLTTDFRLDDSMLMHISSEQNGYLFVFNIEPDGKLINYFPNQYCHDFQQGYIEAGKTLTIPGNQFDWPCDFPVTGPIGTATLVVVLIEKALEYNVLPLVFNKHIEGQHAKSLLYLLSQQLKTLTIEDDNGEYVPISWSVKMADYHVIH
jgi:hypothetical protein